MSFNVAFRVDASVQIGTGHFMRCLTLADALSQRGARIRIVSRHAPEALRSDVRARGHEFVALDMVAGDTESGSVPHAHWLGTSQSADAIDTIRALAGRAWHWMVVDHYALSQPWERALRAAAPHILTIDDLADREHDCDILLDQNYLASGQARYEGKTPVAAELLVGPRYALMRPEYAARRAARHRGIGDVRRVLVFFGGNDPLNLTGMTLAALSRPELRHLQVDVVTGSDPARRAALDEHAAARPGTAVHGPRPHLADLMSEADLAIGAGGATTWERMCLGLPSLVVIVADNQAQVCEGLAREGLITLLPHARDLSADAVQRAVSDHLLRPPVRAVIERTMSLSDGRGVARVVEAMLRLTPALAFA